MSRKFWLILFALFIVFSILRETGFITFDSCKISISEGSSITWIKGKMGNEVVDSTKLLAVEKMQKDVGVFVTYNQDTLYKNGDYENGIEIRIGNIFTGFLWTPLIKRSEFFSTGICVPSNSLLSDDRFQIYGERLTEVNLFLNNKISIDGICSHRTAIKSIQAKIIKEFQKQMWDALRN